MGAQRGGNRADLCRVLQTNRQLLIDAIEGLSPAMLSTSMDGDWSIKDILTHITSWEELALLDLARLKRGRTPTLLAFPQEATDKWNDLLMCVRRALPLDQVHSEFTETRDAFMEALDDLPDDQFVSGYVPGTCQVSAFHDWQHAAQIRTWREKKPSDDFV